MILDDIADYLTTGGLGLTPGTDLWGGVMKPDPDTAMALYETGGFASDYTMGNVAAGAVMEHARIQVVARAAEYRPARLLIQKAYRLLDGMPKRLLNGVQYHWSRPVQPPYPLGGRDESADRVRLAFNVDIWKELSTTST